MLIVIFFFIGCFSMLLIPLVAIGTIQQNKDEAMARKAQQERDDQHKQICKALGITVK